MDIVIKNALIFDGSGGPPFIGDVSIERDTIADVGASSPAAEHVIDAGGLAVSPGFIDIHTHADIAVLEEPHHYPKILQGVTTDVFTNCGLGFAPTDETALPLQREYLGSLFGKSTRAGWDWSSVGDYLRRIDGNCSVNVAYLVAHGAVRTKVMGMENRKPAPEELRSMKRLVEISMEEGARGVSSGLAYAPMCCADVHECAELCKAAIPYGGFFAIHQRNYKEKVLEATMESIEISRQSGYPLQISHFFAGGRENRHLAPKIMEAVDRARNEGLDVMFDTYPYLAGSSILMQFLPDWVLEGGGASIMKRLTDTSTRRRIEAELGGSPLEWDNIVLSELHTEKNKWYEGKYISSLAEELNVPPPEFLCTLLIEENLQGTFVMFNQKEDTLREFMKHPAHIAGSDSLHIGGKVHPRLYGTYPRYLGRYARETGTLSMERAVKKMTMLPAERLGLEDRGRLMKGMKADLVIFDPETIIDTATFENPRQYPVGIEYVIVNGVIVAKQGTHTGATPGRVLYKK